MLKCFSWPAIIVCSVLIIGLISCDKSATTPTAKVTSSSVSKAPSLFNSDIRDARVLVFTKTKGWRHDSIPAGIAAIQKIATDNFFTLTVTEDADTFTDAQLSQYNAIVFLNTSLDVLDEDHQIAMERFIQAGGGFVGIHAAADTEWEGDWYWYRKLVGAVFKNHPSQPSNIQSARVDVVDTKHMSTEKLPASFELADEWYNYRDIYEFNKVLLTVDEKTYKGGEQGALHPITWYHDFDGGRSFYTGLGHTAEVYSNPQFIELLLGGLRYAVGGKPKLDYTRSRPESNRFVKKVIVENLNEPVQLSFFTNGDALIAERAGTIKLVDYKTGEVREAGRLDVNYQNFLELGLLGLAIDPSFDRNHFIYASFNVEKEGQYFQRLARFKWIDGKVDKKSQLVLLEYPINKNCCHTAGDLQFGNNGELFMSTGDNTNPHDQNGYAPIDFRVDSERNDALRSSGDTQDLRGKVLRIKPIESGGYDIPKGNLFADPKEGRPEIYVMGARNPYKITYDKKTSSLFFGDVGPDAGADSTLQGSKGYDEVNRVLKAGNYGWPLFIGNNYSYTDYDYQTHKAEQMFNPLAPKNESPRNRGLKVLPPAQRPLVWYPYGESDQFPEVGKGGRTAIVADVFYADEYPQSIQRYPSYYDKKLFIVDFMRNWIKAVSFDVFGRIIKIEPFAPQIPYVLPIDARFSPDGTLYVLEYGTAWFKGNPDAKLTRVEYIGSGNRPPVAKIGLDKTQGAIPYQAVVTAKHSFDLDGDALSYKWFLKNKTATTAKEIGINEQQSIEITEAGEYILSLEVKDPSGASNASDVTIQVGNEPAAIDIKLYGNESFYWPSTKSIKYSVTIKDKEDGQVGSDLSTTFIDFVMQKDEVAAASEGHKTADVETVALDLMRANGCKNCHNLDVKVVGPSFRDVAARYKNDKKALTHLVDKIAKGGNGVWGELNMPGFATLSETDRTALVTYVLSLANVKKSLPLQGDLVFNANLQEQILFDGADEPKNIASQKYELSASYLDKGGLTIGPVAAKKSLKLQPARFYLAPGFDIEMSNRLIELSQHSNRDTLQVPATGNWLVMRLGKYDLTDIVMLRLGGWVTKNNTAWQFELRLGSDTGTVLASGENNGKVLEKYLRSPLKIQSHSGNQELYLAIRSIEKSTSELQLLDISFHK